MVSAGDGVILGRTTLKLGATRNLDVRVEYLPDGSYQRIPDPVTKGGRMAQLVLLAHDDISFRHGLSALGLNGEAMVQAVGDPCFSELNFFMLQHPRESLWLPSTGWKQVSEGNYFHKVSSARLKELENEAKASCNGEEVRVVGTLGTSHHPLPPTVKTEQVTRVGSTDLSVTAQDFDRVAASGGIRTSTPTDASVIVAGTAGPTAAHDPTVMVPDASQRLSPHPQTESSPNVQTQPPVVQTEACSSSHTQASSTAPVSSTPGTSGLPPSVGQGQLPPGTQTQPSSDPQPRVPLGNPMLVETPVSHVQTPVNQTPPPSSQVQQPVGQAPPPAGQVPLPAERVPPPPGGNIPPSWSSQVPMQSGGPVPMTAPGVVQAAHADGWGSMTELFSQGGWGTLTGPTQPYIFWREPSLWPGCPSSLSSCSASPSN